MRRLVLWTAAIATALVAAAPARAADGDPYVKSCIVTNVTPLEGCPNGTALAGAPRAIAASPDGRQLYITTTNGVLQTVDRNPATGALSPRQGDCFGTAPCSSVPGDFSGQEVHLALSHDGRTLLVVAGPLLAFARDVDTGSLRYVGCAGIGCSSPLAGSPTTVAFSPDDRFVYVRTQDGLDVLNSDLSSVECYGTVGCTPAAGLAGQGTEIGVSGDAVTVAFGSPGGVATFNRTASGTLTPVSGPSGGCFSTNGASGATANQCAVGPGSLSSAFQSTISPDGRTVYVGGPAGITIFHRTGAGALDLVGTAPGGLVDVTGLLLTPDGDLIAAEFGGRLTYFTHDAAGALVQQACMNPDGSGGCLELAGLGGDPNSRSLLASDSSGLDVFATGDTKGMLASIVRDYGPTCHAASVSVPFGTAVPIQLDCADPNGDPLSYTVVSGPMRGSLSGPNGGQVVYTPVAGFSGADQFTYKATGLGVDSAPVTVALGVAPAPPAVVPPVVGVNHPAPPAAKRRGTVRALVATRWTVRGARFELMQLTLSQLPKHWKAQIRCAGKHCPFKKKTLKGKAKHSVANVLRSLKKTQRRFRAGQTLEVWVSAPHLNTKVARLKLKKRKIPSTQALCVAPGAVKPRKSCS